MNYNDFIALFTDRRNELAYISDIETYDMLFMSRAAMEKMGISSEEDYLGRKCYEVVQGRDAPCDFCTNKYLLEGESPYVWEQFNPVAKSWMRLENHLFDIDGRKCRGEWAVDVSQDHNTITGLQNQLEIERILRRSLRTLAVEGNPDTAVMKFLIDIGKYYQADRAVIFEIDYESNVVNNTYEWCSPGVPSRKEQFQNAPLDRAMILMDNFRDEGADQKVYTSGEASGMGDVLSEREASDTQIVPLRRDDELIGFLGVDNARANCGDTALQILFVDLIAEEFQKRRLESVLGHRENTDKLTKLPNRNSYLQTLERYRANPPKSLAVYFIDLNGLKEINEELGHDAGDSFICECAEMLRSFELNAFRVDGDEFIAFQPDISAEDAFEIEQMFRANMDVLHPQAAALGMAWGEGKFDVQELVNEADERMYADKQVYYRAAAAQNVDVRAGLADDVLSEIRDRRFAAYFQPQVDLTTGEIYGAEALVRKFDADGKIIPPGLFIPIYEADGVISHLDFHVLELVCEQLRIWREELGKTPKISVNFSRTTLMEPDVVERISDICARFGVPHSQIMIEVTESSGKLSRENLHQLIRNLQYADFSVSLDDFGTEHSNLSILTTIDFQIIKLDKSLIDNIGIEEKGTKVVRNLVDLCRSTISTPTLAEGVETREQAGMLRDFGCDYVQGYFFSRPIPADEFTGLLRDAKRWAVEELPQAEREALYSRREHLRRMVHEGGSDTYGYLIREQSAILPRHMMGPAGLPDIIDNFPDWQVERGNIAPESMDAWYGMFAAISRGDPDGSAEVKLKNLEGGYSDMRLRFTVMPDEDGNPDCALISFEDITEELRAARRHKQDISALSQAMRTVFPEIIILNLTKDTCRVLQHDGAAAPGAAREGSIDEMVQLRLGGMVEEDRQLFADAFDRDRLSETLLGIDKDRVQLTYRQPGGDGNVFWFETTCMRIENDLDDDVLVIAMTRGIDAQKAEELRLREEAYLRAEELRVTAGGMLRTLFYYDVTKSELTVPRSYAEAHGIREKVGNYPECIDPNSLSEESVRTIQEFYGAIRRGEKQGSCELAFSRGGGGEVWRRMEFATVFNREGKPMRAIIFVDDVTDIRTKMEENRLLKERERLLSLIVKHSDRVITYYDPETDLVRFWGDAAGLDTSERSMKYYFDSGVIPPESRRKAERIFAEVKNGLTEGSEKIRINRGDGRPRWLDIKYTALIDEDRKHIGTLFSYKDVTEAYEHEIAYLRAIKSFEGSESHIGMIEVDLETGLIERQGGRLAPVEAEMRGQPFAEFSRRMVELKMLEKDYTEAQRFFSREFMLTRHEAGVHTLSRVWQMRFKADRLGWVKTVADLIEDPYTGHVKVFYQFTDITDEHNEQLRVRQRSERDGMTGLLNRQTGEERIRRLLEDDDPLGVFAIVDLDGLKNINDVYGHGVGDEAIASMARAIKCHFRDSDIICRAGGDEFIVYMAGAAAKKPAIEASLSSFMDKVTGIRVGLGGECPVSCSIGCAEQFKNDSFDDIFGRADLALYHVKRGGRSSFAFYTPDMEQSNYEFKEQRMRENRRFDRSEMRRLIDVIVDNYTLVLSSNLTENEFCQMAADGPFAALPVRGRIDEGIDRNSRIVHPDDVFLRPTRQQLLKLWRDGERRVLRSIRYRDGEDYRPAHLDILLYENELGEVCAFTLLRWL